MVDMLCTFHARSKLGRQTTERDRTTCAVRSRLGLFRIAAYSVVRSDVIRWFGGICWTFEEMGGECILVLDRDAGRRSQWACGLKTSRRFEGWKYVLTTEVSRGSSGHSVP
jgi:hypothetical protein